MKYIRIPDLHFWVVQVLVNRLSKTLDSFTKIPHHVSFSGFWVCDRIWGQGQGFSQSCHLWNLSWTSQVHLQYIPRGLEHKVKSTVMGCCTDDRTEGFGAGVCFRHSWLNCWGTHNQSGRLDILQISIRKRLLNKRSSDHQYIYIYYLFILAGTLKVNYSR